MQSLSVAQPSRMPELLLDEDGEVLLDEDDALEVELLLDEDDELDEECELDELPDELDELLDDAPQHAAK
jgi:hypothetical protein